MKLEVGKSYRTRDGRKATITEYHEPYKDSHPMRGFLGDSDETGWSTDGQYNVFHEADRPEDLVALWEEAKPEPRAFKVGDKVRLTKTYSNHWPKGHEFIVEDVSGFGSSHLCGKGHNQKNYTGWNIYASYCELVESSESELEELVRRANAGLTAIVTLQSKYSQQVEVLDDDTKEWRPPTDNDYYTPGLDIIRIRKPKPTFPPLTVNGYEVSVDGEQVKIGCQTYSLGQLLSALKLLISGKSDGDVDLGLTVTRLGIRGGGSFTPVSWEDADRLLAALEAYQTALKEAK